MREHDATSQTCQQPKTLSDAASAAPAPIQTPPLAPAPTPEVGGRSRRSEKVGSMWGRRRRGQLDEGREDFGGGGEEAGRRGELGNGGLASGIYASPRPSCKRASE